MPNRKSPQKNDHDKVLNRRNLIIASIVGITVILTFLIELPQKISTTIDSLIATETLVPTQPIIEISPVPFCRYAPDCPGTKGFTIANKGTVSANNVRIAVYLDRFPSTWWHDISSIKQFEYSISNHALNVDVKTADIKQTDGFDINADDTYIFIINTLPAKSKTDILFLFDDTSVKVKNVTSDLETEILVPSAVKDYWSLSVGDPLYSFFESLYPIAEFRGDVACDNCGEIKGEISFTLSSLYDISVIEKYNTTGEPNTAYLMVTTKRFIPETESNMQPITPMHLEFVEQDNREQIVRFRDK